MRVTRRQIFPILLAAEWRDVEIAPHRPERLVAAPVDEIGAEDALAVPNEEVVAVIVGDAEIRIETVVMLYRGIFQPIRALSRAISPCGAREA